MKDVLEVARYLGYKPDSDLGQVRFQIESFLAEIAMISNPKSIYKIYPLIGSNPKEVAELNLTLPGKDINSHLATSEYLILMATTLGLNIDRKIKALQYKNLSKAIVYDACASTYIEKILDQVETEIEDIAREKKLFKTSRFSPGYGDLPLEFQQEIDKALNLSKNIGVSVSRNNLLLPRKTVTAIIGLGSKHDTVHCTYCNRKCENRKADYRRYKS